MKKTRKFIYLISSICFLTSCTHFASNTKLVRNSFLDFDQSATIGEVLENYKYFVETGWNEFTTEQGREVVEFVDHYEYTKKATWWSGPKDDINSYRCFVYGFDVNIDENKMATITGIVTVQFIMNKDRREDSEGHTFKVVYVGHKGYSEERLVSCDRCLSSIYRNESL